MNRYIQYGCGFSAPEEWINYDSSPTLRFEKTPLIGGLYTRNIQRFPKNVKYGDIVDGLPEKSESCDGIFSSHILEHLSYGDCLIALNNTYKFLKQDGIFRCIVPDLKFSVEQYLENYDKLEFPAHEFMKSTVLGVEQQNNTFFKKLKGILGNSKHLWMWDEKTLKNELLKVGFRDVRKCSFGDSKDPYFNYVESEGRFRGAIALEAIK